MDERDNSEPGLAKGFLEQFGDGVEKVFSILVVVLFLAFLAAIGYSACDPFSHAFSGEVAVYTVLKIDKNNKIPVPKIVYKPVVETQSVIEYYPANMESMNKLHNCTVLDRKNWKGHRMQVPSAQGYLYFEEVAMVDGKIKYSEPDVESVSSLYWHYLKVKNYWRNLWGE